MQLRVTHETHYRYAPTVKGAQHMAHLRPIADARQRVVSHALTVDPVPSRQAEAADAFGNTRTFISLQAPHDELSVTARSVVDTGAPPALVPGPAWEVACERLRYRHGSVFDPAVEFTFASPHVPRHEDFAAYARKSFEPERPVGEAARDLMQRIHREFAYESEATDVSTPALEVLKIRKGVCQDFAHVMVACLRSLGLPARYVSGYLLTQPPPGQPRLIGADASHAWVSVYVPQADGPGEWHELDPTNDREAGEDYVRLAAGRDYSDVSPVRGVIRGGARHKLEVAVTVEPLAT